jgi:hypothetical protein
MSGFSFGGAKQQAEDQGGGAAKKQSTGFTFGGSAGAAFKIGDTKTDAGSAGAAFKFGGATAAAAAGASPFSFGGGAKLAGGGFAFGGASAGAGAGGAFPKAPADAAGDEPATKDEEWANKKAEDDGSEETLLDQKTKLMRMVDTESELKGRVKECQEQNDQKELKEAEAELAKGQAVRFKEWRDMGINQMKLVKNKQTGKCRLIMRSKNGQSFLLNDYVSGLKVTKPAGSKNKIMLAGTQVDKETNTQVPKISTLQVNADARDDVFDKIIAAQSGKATANAVSNQVTPAPAVPEAPVAPKAAASAPAAATPAPPKAEAAPAAKASGAFSFGSKPAAAAASAAPATKASGAFSFGSKPAAAAASAVPATNASGAVSFGSKPAAAASAASAVAAKPNAAPDPEVLMAHLNTKFKAWIEDSLEAEPTADLTPGLNDYMKHALSNMRS